LLCCLIAYLVNAQTAKFESGKEISECRHYSESSVTDGSGNVYTTGRVYGSMYLDSTGKLILYGGSTRFPVMFIRKVSSSGVSIWAKKIGRPGIADPESIAIIKLGNLYIIGSFARSIDFDPGPDSFNYFCKGNNTAFILKLDSDGDFLWAKTIDGSSSLVYGNSITLDASGNIYTLGHFSGTVDFDTGEETSNLTSTKNKGYSNSDVFVLKLDASGNFLWAKNWFAVASDQDHSIVADALGNAYTTGYFTANVILIQARKNPF